MRFSRETVERWGVLVDAWLDQNYPHIRRKAVVTGRDAWTIASRAGVTTEAYTDRDVTDGHIQSALERVFPNAVFLDKKVY